MESIRRYLTLVIGILLVANAVNAQSNDWEWIKTFGGKNADEVYSSCIDKSGNIYIAGYFQGEIDIDGKLLKSKGDTDALIAKFDKYGNLCWAKQVGGDYSENIIITEYAKKIKIDCDGNVIVAGIFSWDVDIDNTILRGAGNNDIFVFKYTPNGKLVWSKSFGSFSHDYLYDMDVDGLGNIYISGILNGPLVEDDGITKKSEVLEGSTTYIAKLESSGKLSWLRKDQGVSDNTFISIDKANNVYYGINYSSVIKINDNVIEPAGRGDFLIQKINEKGEIVTQKKYNSRFNDVLGSMSVTYNNILLISGKYANISDFKLKSSNDTVADLRTYFSSIQPDGSLSWSVNNSGPSCPNGTNLMESGNDNYFSTDIFLNDVNIAGRRLMPTDSWFNSYLASHDHEGRVSDIILHIPGIITSVLHESNKSIIVTGTCANNIGISQHFNSSGGFIDFFIGKLKVNTTDNLLNIDNISETASDYIIFPNPTNNNFCTIDSRSIKNIERINITDQEGKLLQYDNNCSLPYRLDLRNLTMGTYFVSIIKDAKITTKQIVVN